MFSYYRALVGMILVLSFVGWVTYPGWYTEWYSDFPELYAWPAALSNQYDPPWGFWYW